MKLELNHFFILVEPYAIVADELLALGMQEGSSNKHQGQGTSNRRFYFANGMLEFLWVHDAQEAMHGPASELRFPERANDPLASPFGVILHRKDNSSLSMPFNGWKYQPDYFSPPWAFHIGENSNDLVEPLCIYVPFFEPKSSTIKIEQGSFKSITEVHITIPSKSLSNVSTIVNTTDRLSLISGSEHLMRITFDNHQSGLSKDLRDVLPLIIYW